MPPLSGGHSRLNEERLREEPGRGAEVLVGIGHLVRVELHPVVVEVEARGVAELPVRVGFCLLSIRGTGPRNALFHTRKRALFGPVFYSAAAPQRRGSCARQRQAVAHQYNTLLETVISKTLVALFLEERVRRRRSVNRRT